MDFHDIRLRQEKKIFDIHFDENGDFELDNSFDINLIMSLFVDARADASEVPEPQNRRGFWGDLILFENDNDIFSGSKLWLVHGRRTNDVRNFAIDAVRSSLDWIITRNHATNIDVTADFVANGIRVNVTILVNRNQVETLSIKLWENGNVPEVLS